MEGEGLQSRRGRYHETDFWSDLVQLRSSGKSYGSLTLPLLQILRAALASWLVVGWQCGIGMPTSERRGRSVAHRIGRHGFSALPRDVFPWRQQGQAHRDAACSLWSYASRPLLTVPVTKAALAAAGNAGRFAHATPPPCYTQHHGPAVPFCRYMYLDGPGKSPCVPILDAALLAQDPSVKVGDQRLHSFRTFPHPTLSLLA